MNDACPACGATDLTVIGESIGTRRKVVCNNCGARMYEAPPRCRACGDALPDGARHCIACGIAVAVTGETTRLVDLGEWRDAAAEERARFYKGLVRSADLAGTYALAQQFEAAYLESERLAKEGQVEAAMEALRHYTTSNTTCRS